MPKDFQEEKHFYKANLRLQKENVFKQEREQEDRRQEMEKFKQAERERRQKEQCKDNDRKKSSCNLL